MDYCAGIFWAIVILTVIIVIIAIISWIHFAMVNSKINSAFALVRDPLNTISTLVQRLNTEVIGKSIDELRKMILQMISDGQEKIKKFIEGLNLESLVCIFNKIKEIIHRRFGKNIKSDCKLAIDDEIMREIEDSIRGDDCDQSKSSDYSSCSSSKRKKSRKHRKKYHDWNDSGFQRFSTSRSKGKTESGDWTV